MTADPAIEAARTACEEHPKPWTQRDVEDIATTAARKALAPIRHLVDKFEADPVGGFSLDDFLTELRPLIYPESEL